MLTTDESQPLIWEDQIAPGIEASNTLAWASGYNVPYDLITPPAGVDVALVVPRTTGSMVRLLFEHGKGAMAQVAVYEDASGEAWDRMMAVAMGIGATQGWGLRVLVSGRDRAGSIRRTSSLGWRRCMDTGVFQSRS